MRSIRGNGVDNATWIRRREFLKAGGCGALGLMLAAATTRGSLAQDATPSMENIKANLSTFRYGEFNPNYVNAWPLVIATAKGYFEEVGLQEVEQILTEEYIPGLVGNSLEIAHGDTSGFVAAAEASKLPIKVISLFRDKEWWIMGVRKGIETAEDLKGGKITGGPLDGRNTFVQRELLKRLGVDPSEVEFVPTSGGSDNRLLAIVNGIVDAGSLFPRHRAGLEEAGGKFLAEELIDAPQESIGAMGPWLSENEDTAYAWALADVRARQWLFDPANKEEAYKLVREYGFEAPPEFEAQYQVELDQMSSDGGFESAEVMDEFMAQLADTGEVPQGVDWRSHFELKYVWAAQEALGLPKRPASL